MKDISDINYPDYFTGKKSKANTKMVAYIGELLKNKPFIRKIKALKKAKNDVNGFKKLAGIYSIAEKYEKLKREARTTTNNKYSKLIENIISEYGIPYEAIEIASAMLEQDYDFVKHRMEDVHLCAINDDYLNHLFPLNPAEEFSFYNPELKRRILAYPLSIGISPRATKDDVIDFINTNWWWIKLGLEEHGLKPLKIRKRKYNKGILELIWKNRGLSLKKIKSILDNEYPENSLVYNEIQDIITYEKKKRLEKLT